MRRSLRYFALFAALVCVALCGFWEVRYESMRVLIVAGRAALYVYVPFDPSLYDGSIETADQNGPWQFSVGYPRLPQSVSDLVEFRSDQSGTTHRTSFFVSPWLLAVPAIALAVWTWRRPARRADECPCGYRLVGNTSGRCPECGREAADNPA